MRFKKEMLIYGESNAMVLIPFYSFSGVPKSNPRRFGRRSITCCWLKAYGLLFCGQRMPGIIC